KGVLITGLKLKAFRNPQPSWGFSIDKKNPRSFLPGGFSILGDKHPNHSGCRKAASLLIPSHLLK
ncbi:hypothetical protein EKL40_13755, partial [Salmonella enterica subsp. enterica serovar Typhimurium]